MATSRFHRVRNRRSRATRSLLPAGNGSATPRHSTTVEGTPRHNPAVDDDAAPTGAPGRPPPPGPPWWPAGTRGGWHWSRPAARAPGTQLLRSAGGRASGPHRAPGGDGGPPRSSGEPVRPGAPPGSAGPARYRSARWPAAPARRPGTTATWSRAADQDGQRQHPRGRSLSANSRSTAPGTPRVDSESVDGVGREWPPPHPRPAPRRPASIASGSATPRNVHVTVTAGPPASGACRLRSRRTPTSPKPARRAAADRRLGLAWGRSPPPRPRATQPAGGHRSMIVSMAAIPPTPSGTVAPPPAPPSGSHSRTDGSRPGNSDSAT